MTLNLQNTKFFKKIYWVVSKLYAPQHQQEHLSAR